MFESEWYFSEKFTRQQAWIDLLLLAENKPRTIYVRGFDVKLKRGQLAIPIRELASRWKWSVNTVQSFIKNLTKIGHVDTQKSNLINVVTICNYDTYKSASLAKVEHTDTQTDTQEMQKYQKHQKSDNVDTQNDTQTDTQKKTPKCALQDTVSHISKIKTSGADTQKPTHVDTQKENEEKTKKKTVPPNNPSIKEENKKEEKELFRFFAKDKKDGFNSACVHTCESGLKINEPTKQELFPLPVETKTLPTKKQKEKDFTLVHRARCVFEQHFKELYNIDYYWRAKDAKAMKGILDALAYQRRSRLPDPLPTDEESMLEAFGQFLKLINKDWIKNNFSVTQINNQFNSIVSEIKNKHGKSGSGNYKPTQREIQIAEIKRGIQERIEAEGDSW